MSHALVEAAVAADPASVMLAAGHESDPWQADVLHDDEAAWLLLCCRQSGKTETCAAVALATAMVEPGALVLVVAPSLRQSQEAFRHVSRMYLAAYGVVLDDDTLTSMRLELRNGSRIQVIPGDSDKNIRGFSAVRLVILDEAARIPDATYHALKPTLATSRGRVIAASTPWFERGWFHEAFMQDGGHWRRVTITADDCPRISEAFLEQERLEKPAAWFDQEWYCRWGASGEMLFPWHIIENLADPSVAAYAPDRARFV